MVEIGEDDSESEPMELSAEAWVAGYAAIVATGALALEIRRWFESGPKIYVRASPGMSLVGQEGVEKTNLLLVTVTNRGAAPTTITHFGLLEYRNIFSRLRHKESKSFIVPHPQLPGYPPVIPHVLKVGEQWTGIAQDRSETTGDLQTGKMWAAIYTTDRKWPYLAPIPKRNQSLAAAQSIED